MSIDNSLTHFDEFMFKRYVKTPKKNYSIVIVFTALSYTRQCLACRSPSIFFCSLFLFFPMLFYYFYDDLIFFVKDGL